jgi:hypothetical protein
MTVSWMKHAILALFKERVAEQDDITFALLLRLIEGSIGDRSLVSSEHRNLVFWRGLSDALLMALGELSRAGKLYGQPCSTSLYRRDGILQGLPIAGRFCPYERPHWLPLAIRPSPIPAFPQHRMVVV